MSLSLNAPFVYPVWLVELACAQTYHAALEAVQLAYYKQPWSELPYWTAKESTADNEVYLAKTTKFQTKPLIQD